MGPGRYNQEGRGGCTTQVHGWGMADDQQRQHHVSDTQTADVGRRQGKDKRRGNAKRGQLERERPTQRRHTSTRVGEG